MGHIPKRLLFTMVANNDFLGTINTNPYEVQHLRLRTLVMYVNGRQIPSESLSIDPGHEKKLSWDTRLYLKAPAFTIRTRDFR